MRRAKMRSILAALAVLTLAILAGGTSARAGNITYNIVDDPVDQNGYNLSGTIVTDGTIGELGSYDIISWQFTITGPGGPFSNSNNSTLISGLESTTSGDLIATGIVGFYGPFFGSPEVFWEPMNDWYFGSNNGNHLWNAYPPTGFPATQGWTIATAAAVPEPSSLILAGMACASGVAFGLARKRWTSPVGSPSAK
jgi:hypothetical protein